MIWINTTHYKTINHNQIKSQEMNLKISPLFPHKTYFKIKYMWEIKTKKGLKSRDLKINKHLKKI